MLSGLMVAEVTAALHSTTRRRHLPLKRESSSFLNKVGLEETWCPGLGVQRRSWTGAAN